MTNKKGKTVKVTEKEPKRFKVSEMLQGDTRLKNESYEDYKERRKVEHILVKQYLKGTMV
jgi:hypothetical protein|tara:strand:+ start:302 stop:481 length:180 start_codon:yes stop_codon:yes gene_type:complete